MIIVTSGHVDHGKTALLKALTGTSTAHLPEEKKSGDVVEGVITRKELDYGFLDLNAKKEGKTIFQVAPNCRASEDYKNLIEEIINKIIKLNT